MTRSVAGFAGLAAWLASSLAGGDSAPPRHLIYLHGRIVQERQSARPKNPRFGYYELNGILDAFRGKGFTVSGEIRSRSASESDAADRVVEQIHRLLASGVAPDRVTVVGASMGAGIAMVAAARLQNPEVRFAVLGACLSANVRRILADEGKAPSGRILSIREASDESTEPCPPWRERPDAASLVAREIVLHTGLSHGFLYRPLPGWMNPIVEWATAPGRDPGRLRLHSRAP